MSVDEAGAEPERPTAADVEGRAGQRAAHWAPQGAFLTNVMVALGKENVDWMTPSPLLRGFKFTKKLQGTVDPPKRGRGGHLLA